MITTLCAVVAIGLCVGSIVLLWTLARHSHDRVLRYFTLTITLLAVQQILVIDEYATSSAARLLTNVLGLGAAFGKVSFFRTALRRPDRPRPRLRAEFVLVVVIACVEVGCMLLAPPDVRPAIGQPRNGHLLVAFIFELTTIGYLASVSCRVVWWSRRLYRQARGGRLYRIAIFLVGLASAVSLCAGILSLGTHIVAYFAPDRIGAVQPLYTLIYFPVAIGFAIFFVGAMLPVAAESVGAVRVGLTQVAEYRAMGALWSAMLAEFPHIRLRRYVGVHRGYYSRGNGIRDGMVLLKLYYDRRVADAARSASHLRGESAEARSITVAVASVRAALHAHRAGVVQDDPGPVPTSGSADWATDTAWIVDLARGFAGDVPTVPPNAHVSVPSR